MFYELVADVLLLGHALLVLFVAGSLPLILLGGWRNWRWVRNPWFRWIHVLLIGVVVAESWFDFPCPLTVWEQQLRVLAGDTGFQEGEFITYWVNRLLFYSAPGWMFSAAYTAFGVLVMLGWVWVRPNTFRSPP